MTDNPLSWIYFPTALMLGALHALEPGHAKTLTAAYLIGIKGTKRDAILLGLAVALTHSIVVIGISAAALWIGEESFTGNVTRWLQVGSGVIVILLGCWLMFRRIRQMRRSRVQLKPTDAISFTFQKVEQAKPKTFVRQPHAHHHYHHEGHDHDHDHDSMSDDEHARAHAATIPEYAKRGERPTLSQILMFGAAGGMIPCPASITVMLLALSVGKFGFGMLAVAGFSLGLAITLVGIGLAVVLGISKLQGISRFAWISKQAPVLSAGVVILSGVAALLFVH